MLKRLLLLFFTISSSSIFAQRLEPSLHFTIENGLKQNTVTWINQDNNGRIWIGTSGSLHYYNGFELKTIPGVQDRVIDIIVIKEYVYCFTYSGIHKINSNSLEINHLSFKKSKYYNVYVQGETISLLEDKKHFIVNEKFDLKLLDSIPNVSIKPLNHYKFPYNNGEVISDDNGIYYQKDSIISINSANGSCYARLPEGGFVFSSTIGLIKWQEGKAAEIIWDTPIEYLFYDKDSSIWIGTTENGVFKIPSLLLSNSYYKVVRKNDGLLSTWGVVKVGSTPFAITSNGLKCLKNKTKKDALIEKVTLDKVLVSGIDGGDFTLLGSSQNGIFKLKNGKIEKVYSHSKTNIDNTAMQFLKNEEGYLSYTRTTFIQFNNLGDFMYSKSYHSDIRWGYNMHLLKTKTGYLASTTDGIRFYNNKLEQVKVITSDKAKMFTMACTFQNKIYITSLDGGLFEYLDNKLIQLPFPKKQLLTIKQFQGVLWITGNDEIFSYNNGEVVKYNYTNGLPIKEFNQGGSTLYDGSIFFSGVSGILELRKQPNKLKLDNVHIIVNGSIDNSVPIELTPSDNVFMLSLEGINNLDKENIELSYYVDSAWIKLEQPLRLSYYAKYGKNIFKTKITYLPTGDFNEKAIIIYRNKPFWMQNWFRLIMVVVFFGLIAGIFSLYKYIVTRRLLKLEQKEKQIKDERLRISRELHDNIGARLTYIISSIEMETHNSNTTELNKINDFARETMGQLRETIWAVGDNEITLSELLKRFRDYVSQISNFCSEKISIEGNVDNDFPLTPIQTINYYRAFQESLNNATKYAKSTLIKIELIEKENQVKIIITDNGIGFDKEKLPKSGGVIGMKKRILEANGDLEIESEKSIGTKIIMTINKR